MLSNFSLTISPVIFTSSSGILSGTSNRISSSKVVKIVCSRRAPMFSTSSLTIVAVFAISLIALSSKTIFTFSVSRSAEYCFNNAF